MLEYNRLYVNKWKPLEDATALITLIRILSVIFCLYVTISWDIKCDTVILILGSSKYGSIVLELCPITSQRRYIVVMYMKFK